ncbi:MAG: hypothetical protein JWO90_2842, partial [Solirubrobacterales bacterium]|nr:hypothetical protein [Solirubrobacterales bacterium]
LALRTVLCARREDLARFDEAFEEVFGGEVVETADGIDLGPEARLALPRTTNPDAPAAPAPDDEQPQRAPAAFSEAELLHDKDFAEYSPRERAAARAILKELAQHGPTRLGRRTRPVRVGGTRPDLPRTLRASLRTGGEPIHIARRGPTPVPRPLVLLLDVSGSMAPYSRMLMQYAQAASVARRQVEAFAFGTRLTRITLELRDRDPDRALERASAAVEDWSGGTRIGAALGELSRTHGRRLGRGAVVVILSDGWDRGKPELLASEMARLRRSTHRTIWLNPLKATPGYAPLARGMAAALPHTDHFLAGNSLRSLAELAVLLRVGLAEDEPRSAAA